MQPNCLINVDLGTEWERQRRVLVYLVRLTNDSIQSSKAKL